MRGCEPTAWHSKGGGKGEHGNPDVPPVTVIKKNAKYNHHHQWHYPARKVSSAGGWVG